MHVRVRIIGKPEAIILAESKLTKIEKFRKAVQLKFGVKPELQRLFYGGKLLEDGYTFHDYNIKLNDVIQLMERQPAASPVKEVNEDKKKCDTETEKEVEYQDAESLLFSIGDLVDVKNNETGAWFEGKVLRIVLNPNPDQTPNKDSDLEIPKENGKTNNDAAMTDDKLLYQIEIRGEEDNPGQFYKMQSIRPRARRVLTVQELTLGQTVMINHNLEEPLDKGYWYDFKVCDMVQKLRKRYDLIGTIYLGSNTIPLHNTTISLHDKIFCIEEVVPVKERSKEYIATMRTETQSRSGPLHCKVCRDRDDLLCKECGCYICSGKEFPEQIILCDECDHGFHMTCLSPPLTELPQDDWYCSDCQRNPSGVIAPGAAQQQRKKSKTTKDWGRGMACAGKTKSCSMPSNHFGPIPGIDVGMRWKFRIQVSESGVHRPPVSGIHGRDGEGAFSIVLSGGYEDDEDHGYEFTYTGSGGRDLSGNKRTAEQSCDQTLTRENRALARNCAVKSVSEEGGDAGEDWREGRPVRVLRSYKMKKHFPKYAPKEGIRYDGIYKVVKYYPETGLSGFCVWKYLLRRDDPSPAPWEHGVKQYEVIYPDGHLEAEAQKKALRLQNANDKKPNKRPLQESNQNPDNGDLPPAKKAKTDKTLTKKEKEDKPLAKKEIGDKTKANSSNKPKRSHSLSLMSPKSQNTLPNNNIIDMFKLAKGKSPTTENIKQNGLSDDEREAIYADELNSKLWKECLDVCEKKGKKAFVEHVTTEFLCIICQEVSTNPVTTPCRHNFCLGCIKQAFKAIEGVHTCPCCRGNLSNLELKTNYKLKAALRAIMPGYDGGTSAQ